MRDFKEHATFFKGVDPARLNRTILGYGYMGLLTGNHELENCKDEVSWLEVLW